MEGGVKTKTSSEYLFVSTLILTYVKRLTDYMFTNAELDGLRIIKISILYAGLPDVPCVLLSQLVMMN